MEYDYPPQDNQRPNANPIFNPQQSFVQIEDLHQTISRHRQQLRFLQQQQFQPDAFTEAEPRMDGEVAREAWMRMRELRENQQPLYNLHNSFFQETTPDLSGWSSEAPMRRKNYNKQPPQGLENAGRHVTTGSNLLDDGLGISSSSTTQLQQGHLHRQFPSDAFTEMEQQMHAEVWRVQMQESQPFREYQHHGHAVLPANFWQETTQDWSGWSSQAPMRPQKQKQTRKGVQNAGQNVTKGGNLPGDRLGNSSATTLMVRNIPVRYTQEMLLKEWPNKGTYDFLYLPICIKKRCNTSFAFINFISPEEAREFAQKWHHERLLFFSARKPLDISLADLQGLEKNLLQCMNNKTSRIRNIRFQPAVFSGTERVSVEKVMKDMRDKLNPNQNIDELEQEDAASSSGQQIPVETF